MFKFLKLTKFRGVDQGRSKFRMEADKIDKINFPDGTTMKKIFKVIGSTDDEPQQVARADGKKKEEKKESP